MTNSQHGEKQTHGGIYYQDVYKEDGSSYKLSFFAGSELKEGAFLKLDTKGKYVKSWEEVTQADLPGKVSETVWVPFLIVKDCSFSWLSNLRQNYRNFRHH